MSRTTFVAGLAGAMIALALVPASAFHIDGAPLPTGTVVGGRYPAVLTSADWTYNGGLVTICENNGLLDDRLGGALLSVARPGVGGLCTTGQNDASGSAVDQTPDAGEYVKLDVCDTTTVSRNEDATTPSNLPQNLVGGLGGAATASGPYPAPDPLADVDGGGNACHSGWSLGADSLLNFAMTGFAKPGRTNQHDFSAQIGAFACTVPTDSAVSIADEDFALYYDEQYAWWSYDGDNWYTERAGAGTANSDVGAADPPEDGSDVRPDDTAGNVAGSSQNEEAFQGHVAVFINNDLSKTGASLVGSVETSSASVPSGLDDTDEGGLGGVSNNCGASPSNVNGTVGPVFRAPNACTLTVVQCANDLDGLVDDTLTDITDLIDFLIDTVDGTSPIGLPGLAVSVIVDDGTGAGPTDFSIGAVPCPIGSLSGTVYTVTCGVYGIGPQPSCPVQAVVGAVLGSGTVQGTVQCTGGVTPGAVSDTGVLGGANLPVGADVDTSLTAKGPMVCKADASAGAAPWVVVCAGV